jgi:hypothetical protein
MKLNSISITRLHTRIIQPILNGTQLFSEQNDLRNLFDLGRGRMPPAPTSGCEWIILRFPYKPASDPGEPQI